jgi:hypothetical protein
MKNILIIFWVLLLLMPGSRLFASDNMPPPVKDTIDPLVELMNIQDVNRTTEYGWRVYKYYLEDVDSVTVRDTMNFEFRYEQEKYSFKGGGVTQIQDLNYRITIYNADSTIYIEKPSALYKGFFQVDLFDTTLHQHYLDSISVSDSANIRKLTFLFKNEAPYIQYDITYDTSSYFLRSIKYKVRKEIPPLAAIGYVPEKYLKIELVWANIFVGISEPDPIRTDQYFTRQNGVFVPASGYTDYIIIDATQQ